MSRSLRRRARRRGPHEATSLLVIPQKMMNGLDSFLLVLLLIVTEVPLLVTWLPNLVMKG